MEKALVGTFSVIKSLRMDLRFKIYSSVSMRNLFPGTRLRRADSSSSDTTLTESILATDADHSWNEYGKRGFSV